MKLNLGSIFGTTFFSVLAALILYDLVVKGMLEKFNIGMYDDTFDGVDNFSSPDVNENNTQEKFVLNNGKIYRIRKSA